MYKVECGDSGCDKTYIGETQQTVKARMKQHTKLKTSSVFQHMQETGHKFDPLTTVSIIDKEPRGFKRGVCEVVYECVQQPACNQQEWRIATHVAPQLGPGAGILSWTHLSKLSVDYNNSQQTTSAHNTEEGH